METYVLNDKNNDQTPNRLEVVDLVINFLKIQRNCDVIEALGSGTYGDVFKLFNHESQTYFAAKIVTSKMITEAESLLWPALDHPNIVSLTEYVDLSPVKAVVYTMPIQETSLRSMMSDREFKIKVDCLDQVKKWLLQTLCGLEYLHNQDLVHLDIKEDNVLISHSNTAMLCDFTCLNRANKPIRSAKVGSPLMYRPPEAFYKNDSIEGRPCDMWAFGIMSIEILADFFLSNNLPQIEHNWLVDVHPTLHEILQETSFKTYFDVTFPNVQNNEDKDAMMAFGFVHNFLKMDPSERATSKESKEHPFFIGGSDVTILPDDIWTNDLYMGDTELEDTSISCFDESDFSNEEASQDGSDFFDMVLEDMETQILESDHSPVISEIPPYSEREMWCHSPSEIFTTMASSETDTFSAITKSTTMIDVIHLKEPQVTKTEIYKQNYPLKFPFEESVKDLNYGLEEPALDFEMRQMASKFLCDSEKFLGLDSSNKYSEENLIPVLETIQKLRFRIREVIKNSKNITVGNVQKDEDICYYGTPDQIKKYASNDQVPVLQKVQKLRQRIKRLAETYGKMERNTKKSCLKEKLSKFSTHASLEEASEKLGSSVLEEHMCSSVFSPNYRHEIKDNKSYFSEWSPQLKPAYIADECLDKMVSEYELEEEHADAFDLKPVQDEVHFQREDVGSESKETRGFPVGLDKPPKGSAEEFTAGLKPISLETILDSVVSRTSPSNHSEDDELADFESFDASSAKSQEKSLTIESVNLAEAKIPLNFKSTTVFEKRRRRKRFIGCLQYKFVRTLMFCCPCITKKKISKDV